MGELRRSCSVATLLLDQGRLGGLRHGHWTKGALLCSGNDEHQTFRASPEGGADGEARQTDSGLCCQGRSLPALSRRYGPRRGGSRRRCGAGMQRSGAAVLANPAVQATSSLFTSCLQKYGVSCMSGVVFMGSGLLESC